MVSSVRLLVLNLSLSFLFGAAVAFHVSYIAAIRKRPKRLEIAKSQVLICLAGTTLVTVIYDTSVVDESSLLVFGLLALGSGFIRFRTPIRSAADTAVMFILASIGIAVGLGLYVQAVVVLVFLYLAVLVLESISPPGTGKKHRRSKRRAQTTSDRPTTPEAPGSAAGRSEEVPDLTAS